MERTPLVTVGSSCRSSEARLSLGGGVRWDLATTRREFRSGDDSLFFIPEQRGSGFRDGDGGDIGLAGLLMGSAGSSMGSLDLFFCFLFY